MLDLEVCLKLLQFSLIRPQGEGGRSGSRNGFLFLIARCHQTLTRKFSDVFPNTPKYL